MKYDDFFGAINHFVTSNMKRGGGCDPFTNTKCYIKHTA